MHHDSAVPHAHLIASLFGTIEPAIFSYGVRPVGTAIPPPPAVMLISVDPRPLAAIPQPLHESVNRHRKGDRRAALVEPARLPHRVDAVAISPPLDAKAAPPLATAMPPGGAIDAPHQNAGNDSGQSGADIYFAHDVAGAAAALERWAPGAEPVMVSASEETGVKFAALGTAGPDSVAGQGDASRLGTPAQRLALHGGERAKAEKCLAEAVYFEARGEPLRGQQAVAQVVMNRVFSGYYPTDVCGVVFENASHYLACQFTFACEHRTRHRIDEPAMWAQAKRIAKDTLDGKIWLTDIGHATHYRAYWVHPSWVHEMTRVDRLGVHTFYRPRAWGSGDYEPVWGTPNTSMAEPGKAAPPVDGAIPSVADVLSTS